MPKHGWLGQGGEMRVVIKIKRSIKLWVAVRALNIPGKERKVPVHEIVALKQGRNPDFNAPRKIQIVAIKIGKNLTVGKVQPFVDCIVHSRVLLANDPQ